MSSRSMVLSLSIFLAGLITFVATMGVPKAARLPEFSEVVSELGWTADAIVVVMIRKPRSLAALHQQLRPERIVFLDRQAIALEGRYVLALDAEAASRAINGAKWAGAPIEIMQAAEAAPTRTSGSNRTRTAPSDISALLGKATLSRREATRVLDHLASQP